MRRRCNQRPTFTMVHHPAQSLPVIIKFHQENKSLRFRLRLSRHFFMFDASRTANRQPHTLTHTHGLQLLSTTSAHTHRTPNGEEQIAVESEEDNRNGYDIRKLIRESFRRLRFLSLDFRLFSFPFSVAGWHVPKHRGCTWRDDEIAVIGLARKAASTMAMVVLR